MGLFFNSGTQEKKNQILRDIAIVNEALRKSATTIDNNGINRTTINSVNSILGGVMDNITRVSSTVQSMTDSQCTGFTVPWIDGRYIGIMTWLMSMSTVTNSIAEDFENYVRRGY
jgi:hypothetical protein